MHAEEPCLLTSGRRSLGRGPEEPRPTPPRSGRRRQRHELAVGHPDEELIAGFAASAAATRVSRGSVAEGGRTQSRYHSSRPSSSLARFSAESRVDRPREEGSVPCGALGVSSWIFGYGLPHFPDQADFPRAAPRVDRGLRPPLLAGLARSVAALRGALVGS